MVTEEVARAARVVMAAEAAMGTAVDSVGERGLDAAGEEVTVEMEGAEDWEVVDSVMADTDSPGEKETEATEPVEVAMVVDSVAMVVDSEATEAEDSGSAVGSGLAAGDSVAAVDSVVEGLVAMAAKEPPPFVMSLKLSDHHMSN
jgi:hypothetical protein